MLKNFIKIKYLFWLFLTLFVFFFLLQNSTSGMDPDLGWHLRVGKEIINTHSLPRKETITYPLGNISWVDHEWLSNTLLYWLFDHFGYAALNIVFSLLTLLIIFLLLLLTKKYYINYSLYYLTGPLLLGIFAMAPHLGVRIQELTLLFLVLLLFIIEEYDNKKNWHVLLWLPPLLWLWASCHGGFLIAFAVLGIWLIIKARQSFFPKLNFFKLFKENKEDIKNFTFVFIFTLFSFLATLITPYGLKLYEFLWKYKDVSYLKLLREWQPFYYYPLQTLQLIYIALVLAILFIAFNNAFSKDKNNRKSLDLKIFVYIIFFMFLALSSKRHFPLFFIISLPWLIYYLQTDLSFKSIALKKYINEKILFFFLLSTIIITTINFALKSHLVANPFLDKKYCNVYPCKTVSFLKNHKQLSSLRLFNSYNWGGFLSWTWPEKQLFIDGRLPFYPISDVSFLVEYRRFFDSNYIEKMLKKYNTELVFIEKEKNIKFSYFNKKIFGNQPNKEKISSANLISYLTQNNNWTKIYEDNISIVFFKKHQ